MTWQVLDNTVKNNILTQINNGLGTAAKISWQNSSNVELATSALNAAGVPFSTPSSGSMTLANTPITSGLFSASGCSKARFQTAGSVNIIECSVATTGADINMDAIPGNGQQFRLDSLNLGVA